MTKEDMLIMLQESEKGSLSVPEYEKALYTELVNMTMYIIRHIMRSELRVH